MQNSPLLLIADEIQEALDHGQPLVALESTVITHGLPYPDNLETAKRLENAVREAGAIPATIAILDGKIHVGLSGSQLETLSRDQASAVKLNLSNLAAGVASGRPGSTTVAVTMFLARRAGMRVFATGGIGGVHRGAERSFDVSADLGGFARYPVAVVSAGAKAILDLPKTVEVLESLGIPIFGWKTDEFPAFYRRESGLRIDQKFEEMSRMARAVQTHWDLGFTSGIVVANPIREEDELPLDIYEPALREALALAEEEGVGGRDVTPFLLETLRKVTDGRSVVSNVALLENNCRVAAALAGELTDGSSSV